MNHKVKTFIVMALAALCWGCGSSAEDPSSNPVDPTSSSSTSSTSTAHYAEVMSLASSIAVGDLGTSLDPHDGLKIAQIKTLDKIYKDGATDYVFTDESITSEDGSVIVNGTSSLSKSDPVNGHTLTGNLDVELKDFTRTATVGQKAYKATLNGKLKITEVGNLRGSGSNGNITLTSDITITGSGSNLNVTGDVTGTIVNLNVTRHEKNNIPTCSGSATVKTATSTTTCTFQEDCLSCR